MKWGVLSGKGLLPLEVAKGMRRSGIEPVIIGLATDLEAFRDEGFIVEEGSLGQLNSVLQLFIKHQVDRIVMAGKVSKEALFSGKGIDQDLKLLFSRLDQKNDDSIQLAIVRYFAAKGIVVEKQTKFLDHLIPEKGLLAGPSLNDQEKEDVKLGYKMAKKVGGLDIGQSVVVKKGMVLAVEAVEGTDRTILRGGELGGEGVVVVKVAKPQQDLRFDVPAIGMTTLKAVIACKARVLAVQAGVTFIMEKDKLLEEAEKHGISVIAIDDLTIIDK
mgnify:FL=1